MNSSAVESRIADFRVEHDPDVIAAELMDNGAVIVRQLVEPAILARFNAEIDSIFTAEEAIERGYSNPTITAFFGPQTRHVSGLAGKSAVFRQDILCHPLLVAMCDRVLRPNCAVYQLNFADVMDRGPGATMQTIHRDDGVWPYLPPTGFPLEFATMVALGPFTPQMGSTRIVPGSHRWDQGRTAREEEMVAVDLEPGDAAFYLGSVLHAGGANTTGIRRRGMHLSYCLGWLRAEDNHFLTVPLDLVRTLPRDQQAMLGYAIHDGIEVNGGFVGAVEWRNPLDLIAEGRL